MSAGRPRRGDARRAAGEQLLGLALSRPAEALEAARGVLASRVGPYEASYAWQATGIVLRDRGELADGIAALRRGLRLAAASGRTDREADVRATLGPTLVWAGRTREGLACLDWAVARSRGASAGRVLHRRAYAYWVLGRHEAALADLTRGVSLLRRAGDRAWEARSLQLRADVNLALGRTAKAGADHAAAERMMPEDSLEYANARHNRGLVAAASGDLPRALAYFDEARARFEAADAPRAEHVLDRCAVLLAAGLAHEAHAEAVAFAGRIDASGGNVTRLAELQLAAATAALAAGLPDEAAAQARAARRLFAAQRRDWWTARAEFAGVRARWAGNERTARLLTKAQEVAARLEDLGSDDAARAHLLAGRVALARGQAAAAEPHLRRAARDRADGPPLARSEAWLAQALLARSRGDERGTAHACARGLAALDEHRLTLGATELRAHATGPGGELTAIALGQALRRGDARRLLAASERWRATALAVPPVAAGGPDDHELAEELSALRAVGHRLEAARAEGAATAGLERSRRRLEQAVRARTRRALGDPTRAARAFRLEDLGARLGPGRRLVELVEVGGVLHAVVVAAQPRRTGDSTRLMVRHLEVGPLADAEREVELARFALRRLAASPARLHGSAATLDAAGKLLEEALLGPAADELGDGEVVVVPPGRLHAVPWGLLPGLADRAVAVAPSAAMWVRARGSAPPARRRVALVVGPGLGSGGGEVALLRERYPAATVLGGGTATAERVLAALDGAWLAHVAAHGSFRADNPLFSALRLDDGPLTVHDLERVRRAPYRLVLSACDSGVALPVGADELLGLASSLVALGAAGILASVVPVNDAATVPLMLAVHDGLRAGAPLAEALRQARRAAGEDALARATAASFVALGF